MQPMAATILLPILSGSDTDSPDDLCKMRIDLLEEAASVVETVVDGNTVQPAIERLESVAAKLQPVRERLRELPDPTERARADLAERSARIIRRLNAQARTIRTFPDLQKAVEGTMRDS